MILVFGSVNLDLVFPVDRIPAPGETLVGSAARLEPGGKGANQACAAARDGSQTVFAGAVGQDTFGDQAVAGLVAAGVDLSRLARVAGMTGLASITVDSGGQNQIVVAPGANAMARADQVADADLGPGTTLLLQMEVNPAETAALIRRARAAGSRVLLNLAPALPIDPAVLPAVDWLLVNATEGAWLAQRLGCGADATALHAALGVNVLRTLGVDGAEAATAAGVVRVPGLAVHVVDTTGAGDCFAGVFGAALDRGDALPAALHRATAAAALSCTRPGAQAGQPDAAEIDRFIGSLPG